MFSFPHSKPLWQNKGDQTSAVEYYLGAEVPERDANTRYNREDNCSTHAGHWSSEYKPWQGEERSCLGPCNDDGFYRELSFDTVVVRHITKADFGYPHPVVSL